MLPRRLQTACHIREPPAEAIYLAVSTRWLIGRTSRPGTPPGNPSPRRAYVQGTVRGARSLAPVLSTDADLVEAATWLHDIGYAPALAITGLHAPDGARLPARRPTPQSRPRYVAQQTGG